MEAREKGKHGPAHHITYIQDFSRLCADKYLLDVAVEYLGS
jgi:hypothetical protein